MEDEQHEGHAPSSDNSFERPSRLSQVHCFFEFPSGFFSNLHCGSIRYPKKASVAVCYFASLTLAVSFVVPSLVFINEYFFGVW